MIFDANAFIGKWPYWPIQQSTAQDVDQVMSACGVDRAAICSTRSVFVNCEDGNLEVEAAAQKLPSRFAPFATIGTPELSHTIRAPYVLADYIARSFRGIRLYPQHHSYLPTFEASLGPVLEDAAHTGTPVMLPLRIVMNWGVPSLDLGTIDTMVNRHPNVKWILAGINYLFELQLATTLMRRFANVYLETSCIMGYTAIAKLVHQCGAQQLLFGSGLPLQNGAASLSKITHAEISDNDKESILGRNLCRLLGEA